MPEGGNAAGRSGRPQKRRSALERCQLAARIDEARSIDTPWREIAQREDVPERTLKKIAADFAADVARLIDAERLLTESVFLESDVIEVLYREMYEGDTSSARVGAARALQATIRDRLNLMASIGQFPVNRGALKEYKRVEEFVQEIAEIYARYKLPEEAIAELRALLASVREPGSPPVQDVTSPGAKPPKARPY